LFLVGGLQIKNFQVYSHKEAKEAKKFPAKIIVLESSFNRFFIYPAERLLLFQVPHRNLDCPDT
jgi:hypothetical protein